MSHGTVREYVVRLRRLGNHLTAHRITPDQLEDGFLDEVLEPWLPTTSTNNYRIALRKYAQFKAQSHFMASQKIAPGATSDIY